MKSQLEGLRIEAQREKKEEININIIWRDCNPIEFVAHLQRREIAEEATSGLDVDSTNSCNEHHYHDF